MQLASGVHVVASKRVVVIKAAHGIHGIFSYRTPAQRDRIVSALYDLLESLRALGDLDEVCRD